MNIIKEWKLPVSISQFGFAMYVAGNFYFGKQYTAADIHSRYELQTSRYTEYTTVKFSLPTADYVSSISWNPQTDRLFVQNNQKQQIYEGIGGIDKIS